MAGKPTPEEEKEVRELFHKRSGASTEARPPYAANPAQRGGQGMIWPFENSCCGGVRPERQRIAL